MFKVSLGFIVGLFFATLIATGFSDIISAPPPLEESLISIQHYLQEIYQNLHRLQVVTSNPDGTRSGKRGDVILLQTGGSSYLEINTDSSTQWRGVLLSDTP